MNWALQLAKLRGTRAGEARVFGVVLYTDAHAHIKKVLLDQDYWLALDDVSGTKWAVFAVKAQPGSMGLPDTPPNVLGWLVPVWKEPNANKELLQDFGLHSSEDLPLLAVFAETEQNRVRVVALRLDDSSVTAAYQSIKDALGVVANALDRVQEANLRKEGAFDAVRYSVKGYNEKKALKRALSVVERLKSLLT